MKRQRFVTFALSALGLCVFAPAPRAVEEPAAKPAKIVVGKFATVPVTGATSPGDDRLAPLVTEIQKPKRLGTSPLRSAPAVGVRA